MYYCWTTRTKKQDNKTTKEIFSFYLVAGAVVFPMNSVNQEGPFPNPVWESSQTRLLCRAGVVIDEKSSGGPDTSWQPAENRTYDEEGAFTPLECSVTFHHTVLAGKVCQPSSNCCFTVVSFGALLILRFIPLTISNIVVCKCVFWVIGITFCQTRFIIRLWL